MSALRTLTRHLPLRAPTARLLSTSTRLQTGGATRHGNDPEVLQKGKESVLRKHSKDSKEDPHWHEELASDAEAFVKANRGEVDASAEEITKLQNATKNSAGKK
ncbi:hypothetical protein BZA05DRAFT_404805 [Tricharina praecox]|uniref:uncharacterized protein n=1 Tax=Tricharina praecox TaxID=43433 RepID=UPI00221F6661|nr:uncharacterized protein BZA05DRAFT_404805 [Tricharina praecox]KAI5847439.1 hypothetical protein BZA05DRAFT_404805 [Tricharina praecox]